MSDEVINKLITFRGDSTFKKAAMNLLAKYATDEEVKELRAQFQTFDTDGDGLIRA